MMKLPFPKSRLSGALLVVFLIGLLAAGCGKSKGTVSGVVSYQGKALKSGFVTFIPEKGGSVSSSVDGEGNYKAENVPVGNATITVQEGSNANVEELKQVRNPADPKEMMKVMKGQIERSRTKTIPEQYGDPKKSRLTYPVRSGSQVHNIELQ